MGPKDQKHHLKGKQKSHEILIPIKINKTQPIPKSGSVYRLDMGTEENQDKV